MLKLTKRQYGILLALLGATLYAVNAPFSKIVLDYLPPILTAGFLYLGSGLGMLAIASFRSRHGTDNVEKKLDHKEWPYVLAMIVLDIVGPICLMVGLQKTTAANASLLSDFEIVATAILAWLFFQERISKRLWVGIAFVTLSCCVLSCEDMDSLRFSSGSLYVILAAFCWGLDNN
ncbi:MAG: DMT family transporter, partial [Paludibacteraceae bacterium]|nr:DMT family transporter [Paludibacteraceae bacterium]